MMRTLLLASFITLALSANSFAQIKPFTLPSSCESAAAFDKTSNPDLGVIIFSDDAETVWNAIRLANYSQAQGDTVVIFVTGKGLDAFMRTQDETEMYNVRAISRDFFAGGGAIYICATCAKARNTDEISYCTITSIVDMYQIIKRSKKVISF